MIEKKFQLKGLDCPVCAGELEEEILAIKGVRSASVVFMNQTMTVVCESKKVLEEVVDTANRFEEVRVVEDEKERAEKKENRKKDLFCIASSGVLFLIAFLMESLGKGGVFSVLSVCFYIVAYVLVGYPVLLATGKNLAKGKIFDENFLMTVASIGAIFLGNMAESVLVMLLYQTGELLQKIAVGASRKSIAQLMDLKSEFATRIDREGNRERISPEEVRVGDILEIKAGEKIPVDGELLSELAELDVKSLTGEAPLKVFKKGEEVLSGCINAGKVLQIKALRGYEDSAVGKILDLVENSSAKKAAPEKFITKFARIYTPVVCLLAFAVCTVAPLLSYSIVGEANFARFLQTALTFLVISCPCALVISVPLTYFCGLGTCAKNGVLVKGAIHLDAAAKITAIAFDKTGTLTEGNFSVLAVYPAQGVLEEELLSIAATLEGSSSHPIAKAFAPTNRSATNVKEVAGKGVRGELDGKNTLIGTREFLAQEGVFTEEIKSEYTLVYVAQEGKYLGVIEIGDGLRKEAKQAIEKLKGLGIKRFVMLTGDRLARAEKIAKEAGVYEVKAELLPDQKLAEAEKIKAKNRLLYVGDGVNDAPVMTIADVAVSMGKLGSAAAVETSDFVLVSDDLFELYRGLKIARKTRSIVKQNLVFSILMKVVFMALGIAGVLPLWLAVFADVGVMLLAVLNALRMKGKIKE